MEPLYYDVNFVNSKLNQINVINFIEYLLEYKLEIDIDIIKNVKIENFNIDVYKSFYYGESNGVEYISENLKVNFENYKEVLNNNSLFTLKITFSKFCSLHCHFSIKADDEGNIYNCISFFYTINSDIEIMDNIFLFIGETFYKFLEIFNPEIVSMGEATIPVTLIDINKGDMGGEFIYLKNQLINLNNVEKYKNQLIFQKLTDGYLFYYLEKQKQLFTNIVM